MRKRKNRKGAAAVEFALVAPVFVLLIFGIIEFGRAMMVQQILVNASREGARRAVLDGATADAVRQSVVDYLQKSSVKVPSENVLVSPDPGTARNNQEISVSVSVPFADVSLVPPFIYDGDLRANTTMRSEKFN